MPPQPSSRRMRGFEAAASLMRERIRAASEQRGFAVARLLTHWPEVVGEEIAAKTRPVKVGYGKGGLGATLTLLTTGANAPILQMQLPAIRDKVNACYGYNAISRIAITQTAADGFAEGQATFAPAAPEAAAKVPPAEVREAAAALSAPVKDAGLRAALEALAQNLLCRSGRTKG